MHGGRRGQRGPGVRAGLIAGELEPAGEGRYYSRSYFKDTARSEERTIVATNNPEDKGVYNNWRPASEMRPMLEERMAGKSAGKTMYVVTYVMAPPGSPLQAFATGVELTDTRTVVLHMIRMARVGVQYVNELADQGKGVLMISSEMPELLGMCDRIYVMNEGRFVGEFPAAEASQEIIMRAIMRSKELNS